MKNNKPIDQNPEAAANPEENPPAVENTATESDGESISETAEKIAETAQPAEEPEVAQPIEESENIQSAKDAEVVHTAEEPEDAQPVEDSEDIQASEEPEVVQAVEEPEDVKPSEVPEDVQAEESLDDVPPAVEPVSGMEDEVGKTDVRDESAVKEEDEEDEDNDADEDHEDEEEAEAFEEFSPEELVSRLEELVKIDDISTIKTKVALIKVAFLKILKEERSAALKAFIDDGGKEEEFTPEESKLENRYNKAFDIYRKNRQKFNELQEKQKLENLGKKQEILEKLKELISSEETLKKTYDEFRELQAQWKEVGMVPSGEISNLWQSYHFLVEKFFDKVKINKELRDLDMKKNLELKVELCEKAEELLLETSIIKSFKHLQKYHEEWKDIGPVPQEQSDDIWERFKAATDKINERRREHYGLLQEEQEKNLLAKSGLCEQMDDLAAIIPDTMKGWQEQTQKVNELFKVWRSIGRAPKKQNTEVWDRFKGSMNSFFTNKKEYLGDIKQEQVNNYNLKVDLCVEAEALKDSSDWKNTTQELIRLQKEWKKIGPVPRKHSDKIWKRFRAACDEFFKNKAAHFSNIHENEHQNLEKKKELIEKVKTHEFTSDKAKNLDILKNFQREWLEIGFVPMKEKEKVQKQFRDAVDKRLEELKISSTELSNASYVTRMEAVKDSPEASRVYRKEINFLANKISQLRDDVNLWENNLGFFANSKKADILKKEFEQKIDKAKQELAAMEAKVKYLRKMEAES